MVILILLILACFLLAALPVTRLVPMDPAQAMLCASFGLLFGFGLTLMTMIWRMFRRASANLALVRTGMGGVRVIQNGGAFFAPVVHALVPVSLESIRVELRCEGSDRLLSRDQQPVELTMGFFVKVRPDADGIYAAARSLGMRAVDAAAVQAHVRERLLSLLRTAIATRDFVDLHAKRDELLANIKELSGQDLACDGLTVESVTMSAVEPTARPRQEQSVAAAALEA